MILWNDVNNRAEFLYVVMELNNLNAENLSPRGETSSLRTQLIEAQILDSQLGADDNLIDSLLANGSQYHSNVRNNWRKDNKFSIIASLSIVLFTFDEQQLDHELILREMDESIIRLRSWQLERQIAKEKLELNMADSLLLVSEQPSGLVDTVESDGREQVISDYLLHHNTQTRKTSASVK